MAATSCKCTILFLLPIFIVAASLSEADILLTFKATFKQNPDSLSSWSKINATHYCNWTGVTCTNSSPASSVYSLKLQSFNLSGEISSSICQLPSLTHLDLSNNLFNQPIPLHLYQCNSLETLNLSNNLIWGTIPDQISQFGSLKVLDLGRNHIEGNIPASIGSLKNIEVLNLGGNLISGSLPSIFANLTLLKWLDLSQNPFLASEIPSDIGHLATLENIFLQSSGFYGSIPESFVGLTGLKLLDLSQNNLTGEIPQTLGPSLTNLVSVDISQNKLSGSFPNGICKSKGLINLILYENFLNGSITNGSISDCLNLQRFEIQNNFFSGDFPDGLWSLPKITLIRAENNRFTGEVPDSISMATQLEQVQIDNNSFTGKIPHGFGMVRSLYRFSASLNSFYGEIPPNFCDSPVMSIINLSHNSLFGQIPELKTCRRLVSLSLADNNLEGQIPKSLADLPVLTYLDLSENTLTGTIPLDLQNLKLALFNVSFNRLSGRVPPSLISGLPASFLQGNLNLCGPGLPNSCSEDNPHHKLFGLSKLSSALIFIVLALAILALAGAFFATRYSKQNFQKTGNWHSIFFYPLRITEQDLALAMAMDEKSPCGGDGAFGRVRIVTLPSGELVAVKRILNFGKSSSLKSSLKVEVNTLAKIRHKNVVKILGYCHSQDSIFLIYEYIEKGSLGDLMSRPDFQLPWRTRLRIAIGVAQGLAYLHKDYVPHILHRNVKARNILLDAEFEPKITDFALDRIVGDATFQSCLHAETSYRPPETGYCKKATEQMDTYGFGIVLLELVTGWQADRVHTGDETVDVLKWVRRKVNISNGALQVLDGNISDNSAAQKEMLGALEIALGCTSVVPEKRPCMAEVVRALQSLPV